MMRLHHYPGTASMAPLILLEEAGAPYERVFVDRPNNAHKAESYLKLNPNGLLPVLEDGDLVLQCSLQWTATLPSVRKR
jgi:glutathione S-transferase